MGCRKRYYKNLFHTIANFVVNLVFWGMMGVLFLLFLQVFFFSSFKIPSDSMEPELEAGDNVLVWKPVLGARLFNVFATLREEQVEVFRLPGIREIKYNDVLVFNFPHPNSWDKVEMHIMKYYIKRCVGLPGDSLSIEEGIYHTNHRILPPGNSASQQRIKQMKESDFGEGVFRSYPYDSIMGWNIQNLGPLYIPRVGDYITMNRKHYRLYRRLIEWEQQGTMEYREGEVFLNGEKLTSYQFKKNYYFVSGDKGENSQDSRYWGLLPEEYIVGKAWIVWASENPYTGKFRWDRFFKIVD